MEPFSPICPEHDAASEAPREPILVSLRFSGMQKSLPGWPDLIAISDGSANRAGI
jgi:hypothetical protein